MGNEMMKTWIELDAGTPRKKTRREKDPEKTRQKKTSTQKKPAPEKIIIITIPKGCES
jgi:hypothetical protein